MYQIVLDPVTNDAGLASLNEYLAGRTYIDGAEPSASDSVVFVALGKAPIGKYEHALRWYSTINALADKQKLPGTSHVSFAGAAAPAAAAAAPAAASSKAPAKKAEKPAAAAAAADDDDVDLFGDDGDADAAWEAELTRRAEEHKQKKAAKGKSEEVGKSAIVIDCKPWDDETDMKAMEAGVRAIAMDGLSWGTSKLVDVAFGVKKLQISCVVVDELVSVDSLQEAIEALEDYVQSTDIASFNKL